MGARSKLNGTYLFGILVVASVVGLIGKSLIVAMAIFIVLAIINLHSGNIRPTIRHR